MKLYNSGLQFLLPLLVVGILSDSLFAQRARDQQLRRGVYTIQQMSNGRYWDAHESSQNNYAIVTRPGQYNNTQKWLLTPLGNNTYIIQQMSNGRYVDAHEFSQNDYALVTRPAQYNVTQKWILKSQKSHGYNTYTIQQMSNGRYVDAHESSQNNYAIVTRPAQYNDTQRWLIRPAADSKITTPSSK